MIDRRTFVAGAMAAGALRVAPAQPSGARGKRVATGDARLAPPADGARIPVAVAISEGTTDIDWVGPCAAFESWHREPGSGKPVPKFEIFTVSASTEPLSGRSKRTIPAFSFDAAPPARVIVVPAQRGSDALVAWLKKASATADVTMSVCVGAHHLAKAGLLDGLEATTHHDSIADLVRDFPAVKWVSGVRFVEAERFSTGGGLTAGIDLGLRVVERYFGRAAALAVAEHLEYEGIGWILD